MSLLLVLSLLFSCSSFAFAEAAVEEPAAVGSFDKHLVGSWEHDKTEAAGQDSLHLIDAMENIEFFLMDGTVSTGDFKELAVLGLDQLRIEAADGETNVGEVLPAYWLGFLKAAADMSEPIVTEEWTAAVEEELSKVQDLKVTYEVTGETLALHVTGTYKESPLSSNSIDTTISFVRSDDVSDWFEAYLCGSWTDANGNVWDFHYEADENGIINLTGSLTDPASTVYKAASSFVYISTSDETLEFNFEDFTSPAYTPTTLEADHLYLTSDKGDVDMTRN